VLVYVGTPGRRPALRVEGAVLRLSDFSQAEVDSMVPR
jgi:hypothetical protein